MKWIKIVDKEPPLDVKVIFVRDGKVECGLYNYHFDKNNVFYWMPMPILPDDEMR